MVLGAFNHFMASRVGNCHHETTNTVHSGVLAQRCTSSRKRETAFAGIGDRVCQRVCLHERPLSKEHLAGKT